MPKEQIDEGKRYPYGDNDSFKPKTTLDALNYGVNEKLSKDAAVGSAAPGPGPEPVDSALALKFIVSSAEDDRTGLPSERSTFELYNYYNELEAAVSGIPGVDTVEVKTMSDSHGGGNTFAVVVELTGTSVPQSATTVFNAIKDIQPHDGDTGPVVDHVAAISAGRAHK